MRLKDQSQAEQGFVIVRDGGLNVTFFDFDVSVEALDVRQPNLVVQCV